MPDTHINKCSLWLKVLLLYCKRNNGERIATFSDELEV